MIDFDTWLKDNIPVGVAYNVADMRRGYEGAVAQFERTNTYEVRSMPKKTGHYPEWGPWCRIEGKYVDLFRSKDVLDRWYVQIRELHTVNLK